MVAAEHTGQLGRNERELVEQRFKAGGRPDDPNVLLSGGWDNTVQVWDVRAGQSVRSIFGPHICGEDNWVLNWGRGFRAARLARLNRPMRPHER